MTGQSTDLTPLLPAATASTAEVRRAVIAGELAKAAALTDRLADPERALWRGLLAILRNEPNSAIRILPREGYPKVLGVAYYIAGQHILFRQQMEEAIRRSPEDFGAYYYLGRHYDSDVGDAEQAAKWLRLALARNGEFARARSHLGHCLEVLGQEANAEREYLASASVPQSLVGLARMRERAGDSNAALPFVERAMKADPRDVAAAKLAARIYASLQRSEDAIRALETAANLAPRDAAVRYQLSRAYQAAGQMEKSSAALAEFGRLRTIYGVAP